MKKKYFELGLIVLTVSLISVDSLLAQSSFKEPVNHKTSLILEPNSHDNTNSHTNNNTNKNPKDYSIAQNQINF